MSDGMICMAICLVAIGFTALGIYCLWNLFMD
jgi:hypothetical protein